MSELFIWIKAKTALIAVGAMWLSLIIFSSPLMLVAFINDKYYNLSRDKAWLYSILIGQDCLVNAFLGGYYETTISSELGNLKLRGSVVGTEVANFVDWGFYFFTGEIDHCINAIKSDDRHYFKAPRAIVGFCTYTGSLIGVFS